MPPGAATGHSFVWKRHRSPGLALLPCQELVPMLSISAQLLNPFSRKQVAGTLISPLNTSQDWRLMVSIQV